MCFPFGVAMCGDLVEECFGNCVVVVVVKSCKDKKTLCKEMRLR